MRPITGEGTHLLTLSGRPRLVVKSSAILMLAHHFTHSWPGRVCMVCPGVGHCQQVSWQHMRCSMVCGCVLQSHMVELLKFVCTSTQRWLRAFQLTRLSLRHGGVVLPVFFSCLPQSGVCCKSCFPDVEVFFCWWDARLSESFRQFCGGVAMERISLASACYCFAHFWGRNASE